LNSDQLEAAYYREHLDLISELSKADVVVPLSGIYVRFSPKIKRPGANETSLPASYVHIDYTQKALLEQAGLALEKAGKPQKSYRRTVLYQTWRAISPPPQDIPLAVTDGRSPRPGNTIILDNIIGPREVPGNITETQIGVMSASDEWYYFSNMEAHELLVWKGYDTDFGNSLNVLHTGFDNTHTTPTAKPRESIETRILAFYE
jgi:hypothetical protein